MADIQADITATLSAQREAFSAELPVSLEARRERLGRLGRMLADNADALATAMSEDFGHRSREQSLLFDVTSSIGAVKYADKNVEHWMRPDRKAVRFPLGLLGARAWVEYQPKGVVGIIAPWNFPVQLSFAPLADVLAAGNRAMIKMSEYTPATSALCRRLVDESFAPEEVALVEGGPEIGEAFAALPFDHLLFTGGGAIGRHILRAAADNLTPVTLELGGKSPVIVGRSADIARAGERIALGKMMNAGQICLAPDYLLVPHEQEEAIVDAIRASVSRMYPRLLDNPDYTAIINDRHFERLGALIEDSRAKGGELIEINPGQEDFAASNARKLPLTIVRGATDEMRVMREEIFGPVLPIRGYRHIDEAVTEVNARDHPLALYYFGEDAAEQRRVLDRTISGGVTVNDVIFHVAMEELPFGGIGPSGMGAYGGETGFRTFSHARSVYRQPKADVAKLAGMKPPYGKAARRTIKREMGR